MINSKKDLIFTLEKKTETLILQILKYSKSSGWKALKLKIHNLKEDYEVGFWGILDRKKD